jgi:formate hydrogenlyase subunit 6/NADH:ubiquinone oxidoreductase subunit I
MREEFDLAYRRLAASLDALPNGFPPAEDAADLRLLAKLFSVEEAELAAELHAEMETAAQISQRLGREMRGVAELLKQMVRKGLILFGKTADGRPGFGLMPFVVGIYEAQAGRLDEEFAQLFEAYYQRTFVQSLRIQPQVHRVIPVGQSIRNDMEIRPFESATEILQAAAAWGVVDCICRTQKALIGQGCSHPVDVCMVLSSKAGAFDDHATIRALTYDEALQTLRRAADAGLVHCVSNQQEDLWYLCNCCTCSCSVLRGMAELGIANVVAHSAFVCEVDASLCIGCGACLERCAFDALVLEGETVEVRTIRCVGCGLCVTICPQEALYLVRRMDETEPPKDGPAWGAARMAARQTQQDLD